MLRNDFDTFDELVRGKLTDYTEPPNQESLSLIHAKKARVSSLYQVYRLLMVLLVAGIGMLASGLLFLSPKGENQPTNITLQTNGKIDASAPTPFSVAEFAAASEPLFSSTQPNNISVNSNNPTQNDYLKSLPNNQRSSAPSKSGRAVNTYQKPTQNSPKLKTQSTVKPSKPQHNTIQIPVSNQAPTRENQLKSTQPTANPDSVATSSQATQSCEVAFNYYGSYTGAFTFYAAVEGSEKPQLIWDFGDGHTSSETTPVHTYSKDGEYTVTLVLTDAGKKCQAKASKALQLQASLAPTQPLLLKGSLFAGNAVVPNGTVEVFSLNKQTAKYNREFFVKTNADGTFEVPIKTGFSYLLKGYPGTAAAGYQPTFWGNTTAYEDASEIIINTGEQLDLLGYNIQLVATDPVAAPKEVEPFPITARTDNQVILVDANNNVVGMGHVDGNGKVVANAGTKAGTYTAVNPSTGLSTPVEINARGEVLTSDPIVRNTEKVAVFPNPANDVVNFGINTYEQESAILVVMNAAGFELMRRSIEFTSGFNQLQYDISGFSPGIYYVMVFKGNQQVMSNRIVKMGEVTK